MTQIHYEALSTRFGIIFDLPNEDKSSLHFLGVYRNKVMHLGIDMVLEYYKIIVAINGALKIIRNTIFDKISVPKDDTEIILELYHFIGEILEIALDYEEDIWASKYSDDFITLNNYLDSILINKDFVKAIKKCPKSTENFCPQHDVSRVQIRPWGSAPNPGV